jgi:hypothetical protein
MLKRLFALVLPVAALVALAAPTPALAGGGWHNGHSHNSFSLSLGFYQPVYPAYRPYYYAPYPYPYPAYYAPPPVVYAPPPVYAAPQVAYAAPPTVNATSTREYQDTSGRYCREYQRTAIIAGRQQPIYGTACQMPDGAWRIVNEQQ